MSLTTDREKGAHLLRRFGLGASEAELDYYLKDGFKGAIDRLLGYADVDEGWTLEVDTLRQDNGNLPAQVVMGWWSGRLLATRRPLQEKMTLFWHDHFATSAAKVVQGPLMATQNNVLRRNATGKFETLLLEASQDPAMLFWLDNQFNVRGKPNENFAREIMELFTLGYGNYTEQDVQEAARAFTGWTIGRTNRDNQQPTAAYLFRPFLHDNGGKTVLGKTGPLTGEDVISHLCAQTRTAQYIVTKMWEWFAYADPEPALIERLTKAFRASDLDIAVLLRAIMASSEFYSAKAERTLYKNPVDFTVSTCRQLGLGESLAAGVRTDDAAVARRALLPANAMAQAASSMGMRLLFPPDVAGWDGGAAWISSATMVERIKWGEALFGQTANAPGQRQFRILFNAFPLFAKDPTPAFAVDTLLSVFDAPLAASKRPQLVAAAQKASGGAVTSTNANVTAAAISRLIFGSPEFQFA